ncbi:MAG: DUF99 family protein [Myxococcota bacterium]
MKSLAEVMRTGRRLRTIGFDDSPFERRRGAPVNLSGIVCSGVRFEGMIWGLTTKDGLDATDVIAKMLLESKFHEQVHAVLIDGVAVGGFNIIDLPDLAARLDRPCIAVMRKMPNLERVHAAINKLPDPKPRLKILARAGRIHEVGGFIFQVVGEKPGVVARALSKITDRGQVPEPLRIAHLIGAAVKMGQSGNRA